MDKEILKNSTILIVDDSSTNLLVVVEYLKKFGARLLICARGIRAITIAEMENPDIVLLDLRLPDLDGFAVCRALKENKKTAEIPVIFMSVAASIPEKIEGFRAGAVDYITKPYQQDELLARITTHLTIRMQQKQLRHLNAEKDRFFSIISHDMRSPMASLIAFTKYLMEETADISKEDLKLLASELHTTTVNAMRLAENLLEWAKIQQGYIKFIPRPLNIHLLIEELVRFVSKTAKDKNITFINEADIHLTATSDENVLRTVIRNLFFNAIKFTKPGGTVKIKTDTKDRHVIVRIIDSGVGIPEHIIKKLFHLSEKVQTPGTNGEKGSGIGLLLCKEMMVNNGGDLWVESEQGKGSTFSFSLPIEPLVK